MDLRQITGPRHRLGGHSGNGRPGRPLRWALYRAPSRIALTCVVPTPAVTEAIAVLRGFPISPVFVRHASPNRDHLISVVDSMRTVPFLIIPVHRNGGSRDCRQSLRKENRTAFGPSADPEAPATPSSDAKLNLQLNDVSPRYAASFPVASSSRRFGIETRPSPTRSSARGFPSTWWPSIPSAVSGDLRFLGADRAPLRPAHCRRLSGSHRARTFGGASRHQRIHCLHRSPTCVLRVRKAESLRRALAAQSRGSRACGRVNPTSVSPPPLRSSLPVTG